MALGGVCGGRFASDRRCRTIGPAIPVVLLGIDGRAFEQGDIVGWVGRQIVEKGLFEEGVESFENLLAVDGDGDFLDDDLCDLCDEMRHLVGRDGLGIVSCVSLGAGAFEDPGGGSPVFWIAAGAVEVFEVNNFDCTFGDRELVGELGITMGGACDRARIAIDGPGGGGSGTAGLEEGDDLGFFGFVEGVWTCHENGPF